MMIQLRHGLITAEHQHDDTRQFSGINPITKAQIDIIFKQQRLVTASNIIMLLRELNEPFLPKVKIEDPDIPNESYVKGIQIPTPVQINNYLNNNLKKKTVQEV